MGVGVVLAVLLVGGFFVLAAGAGVWWFFLRPSDATTTADGGTSGEGTTTGDGGASSGGSSATGGDSSGGATTGDSGGGSASTGGGTSDAGTGSDAGRRTADAGTGGGGSGSTGGGWSERGAQDGSRRATDADASGRADRGATPAPPDTLPDAGGGDYVPPDEPQSGREAGRQLADAYRSKQRNPWSNDSGGSYGGGARFRERARIPPDLGPGERAAAGVLTAINSAQTRYQRQHGRYGTLAELHEAGLFAGRVGAGMREFVQSNYAFTLTLQDDGYTLVANPRSGGLRALQTADHGVIQYADE
jgi:hypothetical protein